MNKRQNFRYDPLYRVIDETEEMRIVEGNFKSLFNRLKRINNLGIIPEVFEMAKYPKYEHALGTIHQVNSLLEVADENVIPPKYRKSLSIASLFLHLGHLPYTYSTERALLLASNLGDRNKENKIKKYVMKKIKKVIDNANINEEKKKDILDKIFSLQDYNRLYRFFSAEIVIRKWSGLKEKIEGLNEENLETIIRDLIDSENDGYTYLDLADKADFIQRDALYFGAVRIDISPKHLYGRISKYKPRFSVSEEKLIEYNLDYLTERFYDNPSIDWFSRLYEKILASLLISKNFKIEWLENYDDAQLKRLICDDLDKDNNKMGLPSTWRDRAKKLFQGSISFTSIFDLRYVSFQKEQDAIGIEYDLIGKGESKRGLLAYPFDRGVLLTIDYLDKTEYPIHPNYRAFSIRVFQDESKRSLNELLKIVKNIIHHLSFSHVKNIREGLANQLSWTKETRFSNKEVIHAIADAIQSIENDEDGYKKGDFIEKYLKSISSISSFSELWHNLENLIWREGFFHFLKQHRNELEKEKIYDEFTEGLLSLPVQLLQYKSTKKYLDEIYAKLQEKVSSNISNGCTRGAFFEALYLIDRIRTKRGKFQFFLNRMTIIDPDKPRNKQDDNEFDVIELFINEKGEAECWIGACSIANNYVSENQEQITKLTEHIHKIFPDLIIRSRYIIPQDKNAGSWCPREEDAGRNYN